MVWYQASESSRSWISATADSPLMTMRQRSTGTDTTPPPPAPRRAGNTGLRPHLDESSGSSEDVSPGVVVAGCRTHRRRHLGTDPGGRAPIWCCSTRGGEEGSSSEERGVGKGCVSTRRPRGAPEHK